MTNDDSTKGGVKLAFLPIPDRYRGEMSIFGVDKTRFNGLFTQNSLDMHKNDK